MVKVKLLTAIVFRGAHCDIGAEIDVPENLARSLVALQRATLVAHPEGPETATDPAAATAEKAIQVKKHAR